MTDNVRPLVGENVSEPDAAGDVDRVLERAKGRYDSLLMLAVNKDTGALEVHVSGLDVPQSIWLMEQFKFNILAHNAPFTAEPYESA